MTSLVTGGAGFLGSNLIEQLHKRGEETICYDNMSRGMVNAKNLSEIKDKCNLVVGDVLDLRKLKTVIKDGVDVVYHMAALPSHRLALQDPHSYAMVDFIGTENVFDAARSCKKKPLVIFASTNKVYGKLPSPWKEDQHPKPEGPYGVTKYSSELLCNMYNKYYDVPCTVIRYHHVAGPRSHPDLALSIFVESAINKIPIKIHGKFSQNNFHSCSANYTHVDDAIRATLLAVDKYKNFQIYNVANSKLTEVKTIAEMVLKRVGKTKIVFTKMLPHETLVHKSDTTKIKKELGFKTTKSIEEAVNDYIDWRL